MSLPVGVGGSEESEGDVSEAEWWAGAFDCIGNHDAAEQIRGSSERMVDDKMHAEAAAAQEIITRLHYAQAEYASEHTARVASDARAARILAKFRRLWAFHSVRTADIEAHCLIQEKAIVDLTHASDRLRKQLEGHRKTMAILRDERDEAEAERDRLRAALPTDVGAR